MKIKYWNINDIFVSQIYYNQKEDFIYYYYKINNDLSYVHYILFK
jgi:hypothetical protein